MSQKKDQKQKTISFLNDQANVAPALFILHIRGLTVENMHVLRTELQKTSAKMKVAKNTLAIRAFKDTVFSEVTPLLKGPTAIIFTEDALATAKVIHAYVKENDKCKTIGGFFDNALLYEDEVNLLAMMPSLDEMRSKLVALFNAPMQQMLATLQSPSLQLARVLNAYSQL